MKSRYNECRENSHERETVHVQRKRVLYNTQTKSGHCFPPEDFDSKYSQRHMGYCLACLSNLQDIRSHNDLLLHCQGCSLTYHVGCVFQGRQQKATSVLMSKHLYLFQCRYCSANMVSSNSQYCSVCNEKGPNCVKFEPYRELDTQTASNKGQPESVITAEIVTGSYEDIEDDRLFDPDRILFRCRRCFRGFHYDHLPDRDDEDQYPELSKEEIYQRYFCCDLCEFYMDKIEVILAWRPKRDTVEEDEDLSLFSLSDVPMHKREYLVKFVDDSYFYAVWVDGSWVQATVAPVQLLAFHKKAYSPVAQTKDVITDAHLTIEAILDIRFKNGHNIRQMKVVTEADVAESVNNIEYVLAKWEALNWSELYWEVPPERDSPYYEAFVRALRDYIRAFSIHLPRDANSLMQRVVDIPFSSIELKTQPESLRGGTLMDYQLDGVNWLLYKWHKRQNAILADDMGLGKTIQVISFTSVLMHRFKLWPMLIVAPHSTVPNWLREFNTWVPNIRVLPLFGTKEHRKVQRQRLQINNSALDLNCHIVITSYSGVMDESDLLKKFRWQVLVVDEGQKLKNDKNNLYKCLLTIGSNFKLLLTGTPLQNNIRELFNLLQFLNPMKIDANLLEKSYSEMTNENIEKIHDLLRPYVLRRTKQEVLKDLPKKFETIVPISMSIIQKKTYTSILAKNPGVFRAIFMRGDGPVRLTKQSLSGMFIQLRKCLCHPYLSNPELETSTQDSENNESGHSSRALISSSGKLQFLSMLLPRLVETGHRALIFTQFLGMLDILEDFLSDLKLKYCRLDGNTTSEERQKSIDQFNARDSRTSVFILSTRAGGVGINLASADTVIIHDQDFNPHQDMQAWARAYRIGQKNNVLVFNLITRNSLEERVLEICQKKLLLDHVVISSLNRTEVSTLDLQEIIKTGARKLFDNSGQDDIRYDLTAIDSLLDRDHIEDTAADSGGHDTFGFSRVWEIESQSRASSSRDETPLEDVSIDEDNKFWEHILKELEVENAKTKEQQRSRLGRGKRNRSVAPSKREKRQKSLPTRFEVEIESDKGSTPENKSVSTDIDTIQPKQGEDQVASTALADMEELNTVINETEGNGAQVPMEERGRTRTRIQSPAYVPQPNTDVCDGKHANHLPGQCPLRSVEPEQCPFCGLAHVATKLPSITCPALRDFRNLARVKEAILASQEDEHLRAHALSIVDALVESLHK
ncbi:SNF2 family N-terminal domain-containing protein [Dipodascopsis uninucleata]